MTLAVELQFLYEEFLEEDLFSDGVDVRQVAAVLAALILSAVERHRFVDDDVLGAVETSTTVPHPAVLVFHHCTAPSRARLQRVAVMPVIVSICTTS